MTTAAGFIIGLDLGQSQDYTALCVVERVLPPASPGGTSVYGAGGYLVRDLRPQAAGPFIAVRPTPDARKAEYHVRHLERPMRGTRYPAIVARVREMLSSAPLGAASPLVVDRTGVGAAVTDMFVAAGMRPHAVTITGGDAVIRDGSYHTKVAKKELVGNLVMLFQTGRLKIAAGLAEGETLANELVNFKVKVNIATGNDSYEAWRESIHDDLVLAVAMAAWHGEHIPPTWGAW